MQDSIRELANEYKTQHPYTSEGLEAILLYCKEHPHAEQTEGYLITLYWYHITDIYAIMTKYHVPDGSFFDEEDLAAEAVLSLFDAVRTYKKGGGASVRTYINRVAERAIILHIKENSRKMRIPTDFAKKLFVYKKYCEQYAWTYGVVPAKDEIMKELKLNEKEFERLEFYQSCRFCADENALAQIRDEASDFDEDVILEIERQKTVKAVRDILETSLEPIEKSIICLRNGIGGEFHSLKETADILGINVDEVFKKELLIWEKLKHSKAFRKLAEQLQEIS